MTKVRIAYVINSLGLGGAERFLVDLVRHLPKDQFSPHVICLYMAGELAPQLTTIGVPLSVLNISRKIRPAGYKAIYSALRNGNFQILHTHLLEGCWYGLPAGWAAGIPIRVAHLQNCYWNISLKVRLFDRLAFQFAQAAFACSQAVLGFYQSRIWYPAKKLHVIHNAVDTAPFEKLPLKLQAKQHLGLSSEDVIITTVASLTPQKGHQYLLEAAREILAMLPQVRFLFVGDGILRSELENYCEQWGLQSTVLFLGKRTDVPVILTASDIFVLPSLWEGFGIVLLEAALARLPVVASKVDGIEEIIQDGKNGFLVPPRDPHALAQTILRLAEDSQQRENLGATGRSFALRQFGIESALQQTLAFYGQLLAACRN